MMTGRGFLRPVILYLTSRHAWKPGLLLLLVFQRHRYRAV